MKLAAKATRTYSLDQAEPPLVICLGDIIAVEFASAVELAYTGRNGPAAMSHNEVSFLL